MQEVELTWGKTLSVWWLLAWRTVAGALVIGAVLGFVAGFSGALMGMPNDRIAAASSILGGLGALLWGPFVVRMALRKRYGGFRWALVSTSR